MLLPCVVFWRSGEGCFQICKHANFLFIYLFILQNYSQYEYYNNNETDQGAGIFCYLDEVWYFTAVFQTLLYSPIFLLGVAGNGLMITVLLQRWRLLRINEIYLLHLAVADLMLLFTFPFTVVENWTGWVFGEFLCKLVMMVRHLNILCGSLLLAFIGFDRYLAIVHAVASLQSRRRKTVHITCTILWLVCFALSVPNLVFFSVAERNNSGVLCDVHLGIDGNNWMLTSSLLDHVSFFFPLIVMIYCYAAIVVTLFKSPKNKAKRGAIQLALLITLAFCFCWLPYNITLLIQTMENLSVIHGSCEFKNNLNIAIVVTNTLGFSHSWLNPFLYAFIGVRFRNDLLQLLCKLGCSKVCMRLIRAQDHHRANNSEGTTTTSAVFM